MMTRKLMMLLAIAVGPSLLSVAYSLITDSHTAAFNSYVNEYRRWPWRAGATHQITTLPFSEEHASEPNHYAIDFDLTYAPVSSVSARGDSAQWVPDPYSGCGNRLIIRDSGDGSTLHTVTFPRTSWEAGQRSTRATGSR